jgi:S-DNA-T family DNA segregation ATPase FtsK/SpoIIIE
VIGPWELRREFRAWRLSKKTEEDVRVEHRRRIEDGEIKPIPTHGAIDVEEVVEGDPEAYPDADVTDVIDVPLDDDPTVEIPTELPAIPFDATAGEDDEDPAEEPEPEPRRRHMGPPSRRTYHPAWWVKKPHQAVRYGSINVVVTVLEWLTYTVPQAVGHGLLWWPRGFARSLAVAARWAWRLDERDLRASAANAGSVAHVRALRKDARHDAKVKTPALALLAALPILLVATWRAAFSGATLPFTEITWEPSLWWPLLGTAAFVGTFGPLGRPAEAKKKERAGKDKLTVDMIERALEKAGLLKVGKDELTWMVKPHRTKGGWEAVCDLPDGRTASEAIRKAESIASTLKASLSRLQLVGIGEDHPGRLRWFLSSAEPFKGRHNTPLLNANGWDIWVPIPIGRDAQGQVIEVMLMATDLLIGGMKRMGKSFLMRLLGCAVAMDPTVTVAIIDGKGEGAWMGFLEAGIVRPDLFVQGADQVAANRILQWASDEIDRRVKVMRSIRKRMRESNLERDLTRDPHLDLGPIVLFLDELHEILAGFDKASTIGAENARLLIRILQLGGALGISTVMGTQHPSTKTMPGQLRNNVGTRLALRVSSLDANVMVLGDDAANLGLNATALRADQKGVALITGDAIDPERYGAGVMFQTDYLDDQAADGLLLRAGEIRRRYQAELAKVLADRPAPPASSDDLTEVPTAVIVADHEAENVEQLRHLLECFDGTGEDKLWTQTARERLQGAHPEAYAHLTDKNTGPTSIAAHLRELGLPSRRATVNLPTESGPVTRAVVRLADVQAALAKATELPDEPVE